MNDTPSALAYVLDQCRHVSRHVPTLVCTHTARGFLVVTVLIQKWQIFMKVYTDEILPEVFAQKERSVDAAPEQHCGDESLE